MTLLNVIVIVIEEYLEQLMMQRMRSVTNSQLPLLRKSVSEALSNEKSRLGFHFIGVCVPSSWGHVSFSRILTWRTGSQQCPVAADTPHLKSGSWCHSGFWQPELWSFPFLPLDSVTSDTYGTVLKTLLPLLPDGPLSWLPSVFFIPSFSVVHSVLHWP